MARKFLYFIAVCIAIFIAGRLALTFYPDTLSRLAFKPSGQFESQSALRSAQYAEPGMWLVSPNSRNDPARWAPKGPPAPTPVRAAVFFVHPTSYLAKAHWNAPLGDNEARTRAVTFIRAIASPFVRAACGFWLASVKLSDLSKISRCLFVPPRETTPETP